MTPEEDKKITRAEVEKKLEELKAEIAELKAWHDEKPKPPHPRWEPEFGDIYYTTYCAEDAAKCHWMRDSLDNEYYSLGFVFKTKDEAEFDAERLKVLAKMREWAGNYNDPYAIAYIEFNNQDAQLIVVDNTGYSSFGEMRFATSEDAKNCINKVGEDRIKKYYFMVPEGKQ